MSQVTKEVGVKGGERERKIKGEEKNTRYREEKTALQYP